MLTVMANYGNYGNYLQPHGVMVSDLCWNVFEEGVGSDLIRGRKKNTVQQETLDLRFIRNDLQRRRRTVIG